MVQLEQNEHIVTTALIAWINKRRAAKSPSIASKLEFTMNIFFVLNADNDSTMVQGLQESNLDNLTWSIRRASPMDEVTDINSKAVGEQNRKCMSLVNEVVYARRFVYRKAQMQ